jgi:hypothetical protein
MSELDELRTENKELKRLLGNALELLEKSKRALTKQAQSLSGGTGNRASVRRGASKPARKAVPRKKKAFKSGA